MSLEDYGWDDGWARKFTAADLPQCVPARVLAEYRGQYRIRTAETEQPARVSGRLRHESAGPADLPVVGDWVAASEERGGEVQIHLVLLRETRFSRKSAGARTDEQVMAANVDTVWIVAAFGPNLNRNRIDRYLALVWESGAEPWVILNKSDLADAPQQTAADLESTLLGVPVHPVSAMDGSGLEALAPALAPGKTVALLGSSGVGKSTLLNRLAGAEVMLTGEIRGGDGKGRHKTTHRQLVLLPRGGLLLDTPGMREIQLWNAESGLGKSFADVETLAEGCRYADCGHQSEPGCAVQQAVKQGSLDRGRLESFLKLRKELDHLERKQDVRAALKEKHRWRSITRDYRRNFKKDR
jgi:ribosome biogenesis GTPase